MKENDVCFNDNEILIGINLNKKKTPNLKKNENLTTILRLLRKN